MTRHFGAQDQAERGLTPSVTLVIIALQHSEDLDRVNEEQKLVLNEDEVRDCTVLKDYYG